MDKVLSIVNSNAVFDGKRRIRGPYLAKLALMSRFIENGSMTRAELPAHPLGEDRFFFLFLYKFYIGLILHCLFSFKITLEILLV